MALLPKAKKPPEGLPSWRWRRFVTIGSLLFICWQLASLRYAPDTRVNDTLAWGYIVLFATIVLTYSGLATVQDVTAMLATKSGLPYSPQSSPAEPTPNTPAAPPATDTIEGEAPR